MTRLPCGERAVPDLWKLENDCLNSAHVRGRHKARVFAAALGVGRTDAFWLRERILQGLQVGEAVEFARDNHGSRWRVDVAVERHGRRVVIRTVWIARTGEDAPQFVTCWVL